MTKRTSAIDTEAAAAYVELAERKAKHAALSLKVSEHPANTNLHAQLDSLDGEITNTEKTLARLASARPEAWRLDDADERHSRINLVEAAFQTVMSLATKDKPAAADEFVRAARIMAAAIGQLDVVTQKIVAQVKIVIDNASSSLTTDRRSALIQEALAPYCTGPFARIIACTGADIICGDHLRFQHLEDQTPLFDAVDIAAKRLLVRLKLEVDRIIKDLSK